MMIAEQTFDIPADNTLALGFVIPLSLFALWFGIVIYWHFCAKDNINIYTLRTSISSYVGFIVVSTVIALWSGSVSVYHTSDIIAGIEKSYGIEVLDTKGDFKEATMTVIVKRNHDSIWECPVVLDNANFSRAAAKLQNCEKTNEATTEK